MNFRGLRALVIGDLMLDEYVFGTAERISPEAPVIVLQRNGAKSVPGGAANVALNLQALGAETTIVGIIGDDEAGKTLEAALTESGLTHKLICASDRVTTRKTRIVADRRHQILRIDHETSGSISVDSESEVTLAALSLIKEADIVVFSDYLKGCVTPKVAAQVLASAGSCPVVCNPKPRSLSQYRGATLVSLNRSEANGALGRSIDASEGVTAAGELREVIGAESVLITFGDEGMAAANADGGFFVPATPVEVADPAGAGDTVIAAVALGLCAVGFKREVFELAAKAAACVVRHVGVATPSADDLANLGLSG
ncbi:MAG: bifunctional ADP-heptose synthase [Fimbriimonadaceae bacterium]